MISMPVDLGTEWGPLWAADTGLKCSIERPWWVGDRRCDGIVLVPAGVVDRHPDLCDKRGRQGEDEGYRATIKRIDREHPLPAPLPMVGQVWVFHAAEGVFDRATMQVTRARVFTLTGGKVSRWLVAFGGGREEQWSAPDHATGSCAWPPQGAVLVAGPSCYGRDVPWCPVEEVS